MITNETRCNSFYTILTGLFYYQPEKVDINAVNDILLPWKSRIDGGNFKDTFDYLNGSYYDSYVANIFPEARKDYNEKSHFNKTILNHYTLKKCVNEAGNFRSSAVIVNENHEFPVEIDFVDVYLFPHNMGIFSVKLSITQNEYLTLGKVSDFLNKARMLQTAFRIDGKQLTIKEFLSENLMKFSISKIDLEEYNPQYKLFINADLAEEFPQEKIDLLLFDIGCISPVGAAAGNGMFSPAPEYYNQIIKNNTIKVFRNWSALSLYDTFTRISCNFPDRFKSWETDYYNIYIYVLYMKFYVYHTNTKLSDVAILDSKNKKTRDEFIEFINDYNHTQISYKFLPDVIKDKILASLDVPHEIERMEVKVNRINSYFQEKRETQMNFVLTAITLLSIVSCVKDTSDWLVLMGASSNFIYPSFSLIMQFVIVIVLIAFIIFIRKRK